MCVSEWGAGEVRQSRLMSEWWQLCDWCNGGRECVSAVHDGRCSPWVMCSLSEWQPDSWHLNSKLKLNWLQARIQISFHQINNWWIGGPAFFFSNQFYSDVHDNTEENIFHNFFYIVTLNKATDIITGCILLGIVHFVWSIFSTVSVMIETIKWLYKWFKIEIRFGKLR